MSEEKKVIRSLNVQSFVNNYIKSIANNYKDVIDENIAKAAADSLTDNAYKFEGYFPKRRFCFDIAIEELDHLLQSYTEIIDVNKILAFKSELIKKRDVAEAKHAEDMKKRGEKLAQGKMEDKMINNMSDEELTALINRVNAGRAAKKNKK